MGGVLSFQRSAKISGVLDRFDDFEETEELVEGDIAKFIHCERQIEGFAFFYVDLCHFPHLFEVVIGAPYLLIYPWVLFHVWVVCDFGVIFSREDELVDGEVGEPSECDEEYDEYYDSTYFLRVEIVLFHEGYFLIFLFFLLLLLLILWLFFCGLLLLELFVFVFVDLWFHLYIVFLGLVHCFDYKVVWCIYLIWLFCGYRV